jgi:carbamate kinase
VTLVSKKALIAVGGNSLIRAGERGTIEEQLGNARATAKTICKMVEMGWQVVVTHGNGPQAGAALLRSERAAGEVYTHTLDMCVATTQSEIGYIMQRAMEAELRELGLKNLVTVIPTMCAVDPADPAFQNPNKPIGPFYTKEVAEEKSKTLGWNVVEDASRGYRRVVPSPQPKEILQLEVIKKNIEMDILTVALGGGGIPVVKKENGEIEGSEAVIDKDRSSALLAFDLDVDVFIISTDADAAYLDFKKPTMRSISHATVAEMEQYVKEGHFAPGSMLPKIESAIKFVKNGGKKAIITSYEYLMDALEGKAGTHITA